ncbi:MAG: 50S ribosomal protein L13 [Candidatus Marinimicrobia bacterium]|nr:50S ribosomal protein L13 [Candidatus Neomarinimicrobiota bacterium]MBL7023240.1 50S ribosomal protein L13 [Candidatus Neomarinimicrobiota bacterium]MBL7110026.1 50S ribosomal protein L13 [Candidatus Neomarinimicrobiota bacterium]
MRTESIKQSEISKSWFLVDAKDKPLGRLASSIAQLLRGKGKPFFTPHMNMGDFVVVINAEKVAVSGKKESDKQYWSHSGFPGGTKEVSLEKLRNTHPERIVANAVKGMLPHNRLGRQIFKQLKVYRGSEHPHEAQQPQVFDLEK